ncbi:LamG-like jellyroll fold domain-containing protein [Myceligenerans indicum]|uniref:LamG domain-containing protein n=1 Tax=Myceligenerans indicum TaxID=2593663 RepID=A0ABS1LRS5_9MICO|nr:LamG-like jellyroll fold domain-containing protein [Myceligenerans indicum]MBL0888714.1 LamG domain-containing protein [Myceligenerans indicum]
MTVHPDGTGFTPVLRIADGAAAEALLGEVGDGGLGFDVEVGGGLTLTPEEPVDPDAAPDPMPADGGEPDGAWEQDTGVPEAEAGGTSAAGTAGEGTASTSLVKDGAAKASAEDSSSTTASGTDPDMGAQTAGEPVEEANGFYAVDGSGEASFTGAVGLQWDSTSATTAGAATSPQESVSSLSTLDAAAPDAAGPAEAGRSSGKAANGRARGQVSPSAQASVDPGTAQSSSQDPVREAQPGDRLALLSARVAPDGRSAAVRADEAMLADPDTAFPVFVDPSVSGSRTAWTAIKKAWPSSTSSWKFSGSAGVGFCDVSKDWTCERSGNVWRSVWKFTGLKTVGNLASGDIVDATFRAYGTHSYSCTATATELYRVPNITSSTNWSNHAGSWDSSRKISSKSTAYYSSACGGSHWTEWPAKSVAKTIASNGWQSISLGLKGTSTTDMNSWKKYRYDARFQVEYNRPPYASYGHQTIVDGSNIGCGTSSDPVYSSWLRPTMRVLGDDPDDSRVSVQFVVVDVAANTRVYESAWTGLKSPVAEFTHRVPTGEELTSGKTYRWRAEIKDAGGLMVGYEGSKPCYFTVDNTAPSPPKVTPLRDHPDAQAFYEADKERGGVGLTGCWELYAPSSDTTTLWWGYSTRVSTTKVTLDSTRKTQVCATPGGAGEKFLYVKVADAAGHSATTEYEFKVATAREDGVWTFDDPDARGVDTSVYDAERNEFAPAGSLSFPSTGVDFVTGPHGQFGARDDDEALRTRVGKIGWTDSPVIDPTGSFVVSAHVYLDSDTDPTGWYTALSQEGPLYNEFRLGYRPSSCPTASDTCWAFGVNRELDANTTTYAKSSVPVQFGQWVHLLGEYDEPAGEVRLYVCEIGTPDDPAVGEPKLAVTPYVGALPQSSGRFVAGRGFIGGSPSNYWTGAIDNVRIFRGEVLAAAKIRRLCQGAEANQMAGGVDDVDPTVLGGSGQGVTP